MIISFECPHPECVYSLWSFDGHYCCTKNGPTDPLNNECSRYTQDGKLSPEEAEEQEARALAAYHALTGKEWEEETPCGGS